MTKEDVIRIRDQYKMGINLPVRVLINNSFHVYDERSITQYTIWDDEHGIIYSIRLPDLQTDLTGSNRQQQIMVTCNSYDTIEAIEIPTMPLELLPTLISSMRDHGMTISEEFEKHMIYAYGEVLHKDRYKLDPEDIRTIFGDASKQSDIRNATISDEDYYKGKYAQNFQETLRFKKHNEYIEAKNNGSLDEVIPEGAKFKTNGVYCNTIAEAIAAVPENGTIKVLEDMESMETSIDIPEGKKFTLKLNDKKLISRPAVNGRSLYVINNYGDVTISGGYIEGRGIQNFGKMTLSDVEITARDTNGGAAIWNEADLIINSGRFVTTYVGSVTESHGPGCLNNYHGNCTINGGEFTSVNKRCYAIITSGEMNINSDIVCVSGAHGGLAVEGGQCYIKGGSYECTEYYGLYISNDAANKPSGEPAIIVYGGEFTGKTYSVWVGSDSNRPVDCYIDILGGIFNGPLKEQSNVVPGSGIRIETAKVKGEVPDDYIYSDSEAHYDGTWTIIEMM